MVFVEGLKGGGYAFERERERESFFFPPNKPQSLFKLAKQL